TRGEADLERHEDRRRQRARGIHFREMTRAARGLQETRRAHRRAGRSEAQNNGSEPSLSPGSRTRNRAVPRAKGFPDASRSTTPHMWVRPALLRARSLSWRGTEFAVVVRTKIGHTASSSAIVIL